MSTNIEDTFYLFPIIMGILCLLHDYHSHIVLWFILYYIIIMT